MQSIVEERPAAQRARAARPATGGFPVNAPRKTALDLLMDIMPTIKRLVERISIHDGHLADQIRRAVTRTILGHGEADGNFQGNRRLRLQEAYGSLHEARRGLKLAGAWEYVPRREVDAVDAHLDRVGAMTWRRLHPRG